jgi:hypothetical protein
MVGFGRAKSVWLEMMREWSTRAHLKQGLTEMQAPRFDEAMRIVGDFHERDGGR